MEPAAFLATASVRLPVLLGDAILGIPAELATLGFAGKLAVTGATASVLFGLLWRASARAVPETERATSTWLAVGAFAALAAGVGGLPGARVLFVANLGFAPVMAIVVRHAFASGPFAVPRRAGAGLLALVHVAFAPLSQLANQHSMQTIARATAAIARSTSTTHAWLRGATPLRGDEVLAVIDNTWAETVLAIANTTRKRDCAVAGVLSLAPRLAKGAGNAWIVRVYRLLAGDQSGQSDNRDRDGRFGTIDRQTHDARA